MKIIDIGANLLDDMFLGVYNGRQCHPPDLDSILRRAQEASVSAIIVTAGSFQDGVRAQELIHRMPSAKVQLRTTVGVHPTRASEALGDPDYFSKLVTIAGSPTVVAIGECGLDYAREKFSPRSDQLVVFREHFGLAKMTNKPMFLHLREAFEDFYRVIVEHRGDFKTGVVHSFDGTCEQAAKLVDLGLYIGINGCSVREEQGIEVVRGLPLERIMVESDAPWCDLRQTHASWRYVSGVPPKKDKDRWSADCWVKGRNEPAVCLTICRIISTIKQVPLEQVCDVVYSNTQRVFYS